MGKNDNELESLKTYIDGKMKRYSLLFSVNGGAFAIIKFSSKNGDITNFEMGTIELHYLAFGAILFTFLIFIDIWAWGSFMRENYHLEKSAFTIKGKLILIGLSSLLVYVWLFGGIYPAFPSIQNQFIAVLLIILPPFLFGVLGAALSDPSKRCPQDISKECTPG